MKTRKALRIVLAALTALLMMVSSAACTATQSPAATAEPAATTAQAETAEPTATTQPAPEPVTLTVLVSTVPDIPFAETAVGMQIKKLLNITVDNVVAEDDKIKVILAAGDLPDIPMLNPQKYAAQAIEGGSIIALDDLLASNGQDVLQTIPKTVDYSKKFLSNSTGKLYFLPVNVGLDAMGSEPSLGFVIRWDYYKDLGFPAINSENDLLNVLKQMVDAHPTTADGSKVYGVGAWGADWALWPYFMPMAIVYGYSNFAPAGYLQKCDTNEILNNYLTTDSPLWKTVEFYYKANKMGLFDPDSFTMKYGDFEAKATNGQELYAPASWPFSKINGTLSAEGKGFEAIPLEWGYQWAGSTQIGWVDKSWTISKNCKAPDRAMDLINLLWSYEGSRLAYSGVKGQQWDVANGVPTLNAQFIADRNAKNDAFKKTGVRQENIGIYCGLGNFIVNPADNAEVDLFSSAGIFSTLTETNPFLKDYSAHYGVSYPAEIFLKNVAAGKSINQAKMDVRIPSAIATVPDDIKRIDTKLDEIMTQAVARAVMAKSDDEFNAIKTQTMADLKAAGADASNDWWVKAWADAKAAVEAK